MTGQPIKKTLKENCGNCIYLTWNKRDETWDMSGEFKVISSLNTRCSHSLMTWKGMVDVFRSECLFWQAAV